MDSGTALVLAMLAWPFPLARALLPVPALVLSILLFWQVVQIGYYALTIGIWGATGGMKVTGLVAVTADGATPTRGRRATWALVAGALAVVVIVAPEVVTLPTRATGIRLTSARRAVG